MRILVHSRDPHLVIAIADTLLDHEVLDPSLREGEGEERSPSGTSGWLADLHIVDHRRRKRPSVLRTDDDAPILALVDLAAAKPLRALAAVPYPSGETALPEVVRLIDALRDREEASRRAEMVASALAGSRQGGLALTSVDGRIIFSNRGLSELFGYSSDELRWLPSVEQLVAPERRGEIYRARRALLEDPDGTSGIVQLWLHHDGSLLQTEVAATRYLVDDEPMGLVVELRDVSEELHLRERLHDATSRLLRIEGLTSQLRALTRLAAEVGRRFSAQVATEEERLELGTLQHRGEELAAELHRIIQPPDDVSGPITSGRLRTMARDASQIARDLFGSRLTVTIDVPDDLPPLDVPLIEARRLLRRLVAASCRPLQERSREALEFTYEPELVIRASTDQSSAALTLEVSHNGAPWGHPGELPRAVASVIEQSHGQAILSEPSSGFHGIVARFPVGTSVPAAVWHGPAPAQGALPESVLLVLEEVHLHEFLAPALQEAGYAVRSVTSHDAALRLLAHQEFKVAVIGIEASLTDERKILDLRNASPGTALVLVGDALSEPAPPNLPFAVISVTDPTDVVLLTAAVEEAFARVGADDPELQ